MSRVTFAWGENDEFFPLSRWQVRELLELSATEAILLPGKHAPHFETPGVQAVADLFNSIEPLGAGCPAHNSEDAPIRGRYEPTAQRAQHAVIYFFAITLLTLLGMKSRRCTRQGSTQSCQRSVRPTLV